MIGRERRQFDRDPHQADIVGRQRQVHAEHHQLEHHVVEAQIAGRETSRLQFMPDVAGAEDTRRETHEGVQGDEHHVEVVGEQQVVDRRPAAEEQ